MLGALNDAPDDASISWPWRLDRCNPSIDSCIQGYRVKAAVPHRHWQRAEAAAMLARVRELAGQFAAVKEPAANERLARNTVAVYLAPL